MNPLNNLIHIAEQIALWTNLGVELPKELTDALDRFDALQWVEVGYKPVFDLESVTPENAEEKVREFAGIIANHIPLPQENGVPASVLESAKSWAQNEAAGAVRQAAIQATPQIIEELSPKFEEHAEAYADAALKLPEKITSDDLVKAGPDALAAYGVVKREAAYINNISAWIDEAGALRGGNGAETFLRVLAPEDGLQLAELDRINNAHKSADPTYHAVVPVYFAAARIGVPFRINTSREAANLRRRLEAELRSQSSRSIAVAYN